MSASCVVNVLVPFATRLGDDGLVHVRAWRCDTGDVIVVAEPDWPMLVRPSSAGYSGPGVFTYPHYALPAALAACEAAQLESPDLVVRLPAPPGERYLRVVDPDDPQGWTPVDPADLDRRLAGAHWPGPPPGRYTRVVVEHWIRDGALPPP